MSANWRRAKAQIKGGPPRDVDALRTYLRGAIDLAEIVDYIAPHSPRNALKVFDALHAAMGKIAQFPGMGHRRVDLTDRPILFWRVYSYLIVYRADRKPLVVLRIIHAAREIDALLRESRE